MSDAPRWKRFPQTLNYSGDKQGPVILDANQVVGIESARLSSLLSGVFRTKERKADCTVVSLSSGESYYIDAPLIVVIEMLEIKES